MIEVKIVIPSKGRAGIISTHNYVKNCVVCVAENEKAAYAEHNPGLEVVPHPNDVLGIGMKRQWIFEKFGNVFMMDDDLKGISRLTQIQGESQYLTPDQCYAIIQATANMANLVGAHLFGYNNFVRPEHYHGHTPFALTGFINGCGMGLLASGKLLRFNPALRASQDYYICALNAFHYRKCFIDKRYCIYQNSIAENIGGCAGLRTNQVEKEDFETLRHYFGPAIVSKRDRVQKAKHKYSKSLQIPF